jgi:hypothetical protein
MKSPENRNHTGCNINDMMLFNDIIRHLELAVINFHGRSFTWSNMQPYPLLEKLDWVFTSSSWALSYPDTSIKVLDRPVFDHSPFAVTIWTHIPKSKVFRFENYRLDFPDFLSIVDLHWNIAPYFANAAQTLNAKFRQVRAGLKFWSKELSKLYFVLDLLDTLEEQRSLSSLESAFRRLVKQHLSKLLEAKKDLLEAEKYN